LQILDEGTATSADSRLDWHRSGGPLGRAGFIHSFCADPKRIHVIFEDVVRSDWPVRGQPMPPG
jgi:hypothetical protein